MNFSELKATAAAYLSASPAAVGEIGEAELFACFSELEQMDCFRAVSAEYDTPPQFLNKEPYTSFLKGASGLWLVAYTLGGEVERRLRRLSLVDLPQMLLFDACANAYLEHRAEEHRRSLGAEASYLFCPGYGGSEVGDLRPLFAELRAQRLGMELTESGMIRPQKSMAGIIAKGTKPQMSCNGCARIEKCPYRRVGKRCERSENV